jgi:iron complex outermembrane recepter protein
MPPRLCLLACASLGGLALACPALAQSDVALPEIVVSGPLKPPRHRKPAQPKPPVVAAPAAPAQPPSAAGMPGPTAIKERYQLPQTVESVTAERIERTINVVDTADAVKYMPSLFVRKRNEGDNQAVLATRSWGLSSSARTLIYADDILISTLLGNNNSNASPRWGMIAPEEIKRIDFLYGPFSAAYPGNSMGGVLNITTRMPDKFEQTLKQSESFQSFSFYNTRDTYRTDQTSGSIGNRWGDFRAFVSFNFQNSFSQPLAWVTTASAVPAGVNGVILQPSRTGGVGNVLGAGGLLHTEQTNTKGKFALDITPWLTATYTVGYWSNDQKSRVQTYLTDAAGNPTYGGSTAGSAFASNYFNLNQQNLANALSLKTDTHGQFDWDVVVTRYDYLQDIQRNPFTVAPTGAAFTNTGKIARLDGTSWTIFDANGIWRPSGPGGAHEVSFGAYFDQYVLDNPTYQTPTWFGGPDSTGALYSVGNGKTQTEALWLQDAWKFAQGWKLTLGGRGETWRAFDGFNLSTLTTAATGAITGTSAVNQPSLDATRFSPKGTLSFEPNKQWLLTASVGIANRFPTVTELYQNATAAGVVVFPNPNLSPERALATELAVERRFVDGKVRLSLFEDDTRNALISQNGVVAGTVTPTAFVTNVDKVRNRGVELAWQKSDVFIRRVEWFGSVTFADPRILSDPTFVSATGTTATGKRIPNVPVWRSTFGATYSPTDNWSWTLAGRYQGKTYSTLDNTDTVPNVFQAFDPFLVFDTRVQYKLGERGSIALGVDNLTNEKYHLFHPFPQRTYVAQGRVTF